MSYCNIGLGLRTDHYSDILNNPPQDIQWFEAVTENYMDSQGRPLKVLESVRENFPVALHGVSLSLGSTEEFNPKYLKNWKALVDRIDPMIVSDHLCWTGNAHGNIHDLLPLPFTVETLKHLENRIQFVQDHLRRGILVENVSSYLTYKHSEMKEWEFLVELCKRTDCKLLLDINNIYVSAVNHGFSPVDYLNAIPAEMIGQVHLAGFSDEGDFLFDTHSKPVHPDVWSLYKIALKKIKDVPIMVEWDEDIPSFERYKKEALKARDLWESIHGSKPQEFTATL